METDDTVAIQLCEFIYSGVAEVVEDGCVIEPDTHRYVEGFLQTLPVPPPMTESQAFAICLFLGNRIDVDPNTGQRVLCPDACEAARDWVELRADDGGCPLFPLNGSDQSGGNAGSGGAGSAGAGTGGRGG